MTLKENSWDEIYKNLSNKKIPWEEESLDKKKPTSLILSLFTKYLKSGKVLDIGCGRGQYSFFLKQHGYTPVGIDISKIAIKEAKKIVRRVKFKVCDILELPFRNEYFDGIIDIGVFHYIKKANHTQYIKEITRVLRKGGVYGFFTFSGDDSNCRSSSYSFLSRLGTSVYFSTKRYLNNLFSSHFNLKDFKKITWGSKTSKSIHSAWYGIGIKK